MNMHRSFLPCHSLTVGLPATPVTIVLFIQHQNSTVLAVYAVIHTILECQLP